MGVIALFAWPAAVRRHGLEACAILTGFLCYFIPFVFYEAPVGNLAYGPRYQTVVLPLLTFGLVGLGAPDHLTRFWSRTQITLVALFALAVNAAGALPYWHSWDGHPLFGEGEAPVCLSDCEPAVFEREYEVARNLQVDGYTAASLPLLQRLSETHPGERDIDFLLGFALQTADRSEEAAAAYTRYLERHPDDRLTHFNLGYAHLNLGEWSDCVVAFERSLELAPERREADTPLAICRDQIQ